MRRSGKKPPTYLAPTVWLWRRTLTLALAIIFVSSVLAAYLARQNWWQSLAALAVVVLGAMGQNWLAGARAFVATDQLAVQSRHQKQILYLGALIPAMPAVQKFWQRYGGRWLMLRLASSAVVAFAVMRWVAPHTGIWPVLTAMALALAFTAELLWLPVLMAGFKLGYQAQVAWGAASWPALGVGIATVAAWLYFALWQSDLRRMAVFLREDRAPEPIEGSHWWPILIRFGALAIAIFCFLPKDPFTLDLFSRERPVNEQPAQSNPSVERRSEPRGNDAPSSLRHDTSGGGPRGGSGQGAKRGGGRAVSSDERKTMRDALAKLSAGDMSQSELERLLRRVPSGAVARAMSRAEARRGGGVDAEQPEPKVAAQNPGAMPPGLAEELARELERALSEGEVDGGEGVGEGMGTSDGEAGDLPSTLSASAPSAADSVREAARAEGAGHQSGRAGEMGDERGADRGGGERGHQAGHGHREVGSRQAAQAEPQSVTEPEAKPPEDEDSLLKQILLAVVIVLLAVMIWQLLRGKKRGSESDQGEDDTEDITPVDPGRARASLSWFQNRCQALFGHPIRDGQDAKARLIELYNLLLAHAGECGVARSMVETADEYTGRFGKVLPPLLPNMTWIGSVFNRALYGNVPPTPDEFGHFVRQAVAVATVLTRNIKRSPQAE